LVARFIYASLYLMTRQEKMLAKKRGRPATGRGQTIGVRIHDETLAVLDKWIARQAALPTRPEAIRIALSDWLTGLGLIKECEDDPENASGPKGRAKSQTKK
jgi:hypothetical protein